MAEGRAICAGGYASRRYPPRRQRRAACALCCCRVSTKHRCCAQPRMRAARSRRMVCAFSHAYPVSCESAPRWRRQERSATMPPRVVCLRRATGLRHGEETRDAHHTCHAAAVATMPSFHVQQSERYRRECEMVARQRTCHARLACPAPTHHKVGHRREEAGETGRGWQVPAWHVMFARAETMCRVKSRHNFSSTFFC